MLGCGAGDVYRLDGEAPSFLSELPNLKKYDNFLTPNVSLY